MAVKFRIQLTETYPSTIDSSGTVTAFANSVDDVDNFTRTADNTGVEFTKDGDTGYVSMARVLFITPYTA